VPNHALREARLSQAISAMRAALAHRGEQRPMEWLEALVGLPFAMSFDPDHPAASVEPIEGSPFETIAGALGYAHNTISGSGAESAFATLHQALLQGQPVLVRYGSNARWTIITGYDRKDDVVYFMPPGRESYASSGREQFLSGWRAGSGKGSGLAGPQPFHQFSLGARLAEPSDDDLLRAIVQRAATVMQRRSLGGAPAGTSAWEAVGTWLEMCVDPDEPKLRETAVTWADKQLRPHLARAEAATSLLQRAESVIPEIEGAAARHAELRQEAAVVARKVHEAETAEEDPATKWRAAAAQANYVAALHQRLAEQLAAAVDETIAWRQSPPESG
jgi:hypothetical protein